MQNAVTEIKETTDPEDFAYAQAKFGNRIRKDLSFYLESYLQMCNEVNQRPLPQMVNLFQAQEKKHLLKRIAQKTARIYLPGNHASARRLMNDEDLTVLCRFLGSHFGSKITNLDMRYNDLRDIFALSAFMIRFHSIKELNLMFNDLTDFGVSALKNAAVASNSLIALCLSGVPLSSFGGMEVASMVCDVPTLRYLNLSYCNLELEAIIALLVPISTNFVKLEAVDLTSAHIQSWADQRVLIDQCSSMLTSSQFLIELHLGKISLDDFGLERLVTGLHCNTVLKYLDLHGNKLNRDGARTVMKYLLRNEVLQVLDLDSNHFTDEGAKYLANGVYDNQTLRTLSLRNCAYGDKGLQYLAAAIKSGKLKDISVWQGTSLSGDGCKAFFELIKSKRLEADQLDVVPYEVDGIYSVAEKGHRGLCKWNAYTPKLGSYSHQACYNGFVTPSPQAYWIPAGLKPS